MLTTIINTTAGTYRVQRGFGRWLTSVINQIVRVESNDYELRKSIMGLVGYTVSRENYDKWPAFIKAEVTVYCAVCHSIAGDGSVQGYRKPDYLPDAWKGVPIGSPKKDSMLGAAYSGIPTEITEIPEDPVIKVDVKFKGRIDRLRKDPLDIKK